MSRYHSYLNSATKILASFNGEEPFSSFLKRYFALNKKYGSKDRKQISHLCYCFFRLGKALPNPETEERILVALFLCSTYQNEILQNVKPGWNKMVGLNVEEKFSIVNFPFSIPDIFPWKDELSDGVDHEKYCESFFIQPDLFLRLRPGKEELVKQKLQKAGVDYKVNSPSCLALSNASKVDTVELDKEAVVQDHSSQQIGNFLKPVTGNLQPKTISVWDCCAGSGGKSILVYDSIPNIKLTVSDIRENILANLRKRFHKAGIKNYKSEVVDLTNNRQPVTANYDFIIADIPCTGSGTWSRTPEQLCFFDKKKIEEFSALQKKIVSNVIPHLKTGGYFLYITCSVFKKENESIVEYILDRFNLQKINIEILKGYDKKADTMFVALLQKRL